jgi:hypothetical protein
MMMGLPKAKNRGGRPRRRKIKPGDRVPIGLRVTPQMKARIDSAATDSGRSQSQEIEMRLERSFSQEQVAHEIIGAIYGDQIGGMMIMLGAAIKTTGSFATMAGILPSAAVADSWLGEDSWLKDPFLFDQVSQAVATIVEAHRPPGAILRPDQVQHLPEELGALAAKRFLQLLASGHTERSFEEWREGVSPPPDPEAGVWRRRPKDDSK